MESQHKRYTRANDELEKLRATQTELRRNAAKAAKEHRAALNTRAREAQKTFKGKTRQFGNFCSSHNSGRLREAGF